MSGLSLGLFAGIKFPLFVPLIILSDIYLFGSKGQLKNLSTVFALGLITFIAGYWQFLLSTTNPIRLVKNLLWTVNFYRISKVPLVPAQLFPAVFLQKYFSPSHQGLVKPDHWQFSWPLIFSLFFYKLGWQVWQMVKKKKINLDHHLTEDYLLFLIVGFIIVLSLVNFWQRYLLILLPLMIIFLFTGLRR